eukprot:scaffold36532_cov118-Isochrysis_galbana.AAC.1
MEKTADATRLSAPSAIRRLGGASVLTAREVWPARHPLAPQSVGSLSLRVPAMRAAVVPVPGDRILRPLI